MRRRTDADDLRPVNNTFQTITAAADAIATVDHRFPRATAVQFPVLLFVWLLTEKKMGQLLEYLLVLWIPQTEEKNWARCFGTRIKSI